jgi:hypothetical protein
LGSDYITKSQLEQKQSGEELYRTKTASTSGSNVFYSKKQLINLTSSSVCFSYMIFTFALVGVLGGNIKLWVTLQKLFSFST